MKRAPRKSSPRLPGYDYGLTAFYFITICTANKALRFGAVVEGQMRLNAAGKLVNQAWRGLPNHYMGLRLDEFVVMPNHFHAIAILAGSDRLENLSLRKRHGLSEIIRGFKTWSARRVNEFEGRSGNALWQRSFYDHIIRDEMDLQHIRDYIVNNPLKWDLDSENPSVFRAEP
ncbi:MAG: transposase [Anaerolineales bacterium]